MFGVCANALEARFDENISRMVKPRGKIIVALSGGADSVALFRLCIRPPMLEKYIIEAVHVEHGIRGKESVDDAEFVSKLCESFGIRLTLRSVDVPRLAAANGTGIEDAARRLRYNAFAETIKERHGDYVALAHHAGDQAETLIMRLVHGTGLTGLAGMRDRDVYIRPLLDIMPSDLREYLATLDQPWREDKTNRDMNQPRAFIRAIVMPALNVINHKATESIARTARILQGDEDLLTSIVDTWLSSHAKITPYGGFVTLDEQTDDRAFLARVALTYARTLGIPSLVARTVDEITGDRKIVNLPGSWRVEKSRERLHFVSPEPRVPSISISIFEGLSYTIIKATEKDATKATLKAADEDGRIKNGERLKSQLAPLWVKDSAAVFRFAKHDDYIVPFGMNGTRLLSDVFTDMKIDRPFREYVPVLAIGREVLWAVGVKASEKLRVNNNKESLLISWKDKLIWE